MISKWIIDKVTQRNPTLQEFIENYGDLNKGGFQIDALNSKLPIGSELVSEKNAKVMADFENP